MSDKPFFQLNELDRMLRTHFPVGMDTPSIRVKIELLNGFEIFNTRPYHNLETWSDGYLLTDTETGVKYSAEDLDDAVKGFVRAVNKYREEHRQRVTKNVEVRAVEDVSL